MADAYISGLTAAASLTGDEIAEISQLSTTVTMTAATLSALAADNSYNDSANGFVTAGFTVGMRVRVQGFTGNVVNNIIFGIITALTAAKMTIGGAEGNVIVDDAAGESVTIAKWNTRRCSLDEIAALGAASTLGVDVVAAATYDLVTADAGRHKRFTDGSAIVTVQAGQFTPGDRIRITDVGGGLTLDDDGGAVILNSRDGALASGGAFAVLEVECVDVDEFDILGDLA